MFTIHATVIKSVNYNYNTFIVQATVLTIVNYNRDTLIIHATGTPPKLLHLNQAPNLLTNVKLRLKSYSSQDTLAHYGNVY